MSKNLFARIAVAVVAIPAILWICYQGGTWLLGLVLLLATLGCYEFFTKEGFPLSNIFFWFASGTVILSILISTGYIQVTQFISQIPDNNTALLILLFLFFVITTKLYALGKDDPSELFKRQSRLLWGVIYLGMLYPFVYKVGNDLQSINGGDAMFFLFAILWSGDTAALGFGKWLGKHKLAPAVSPNKTVEGFIGGIVGAMVVTVVIYFWRLQHLPMIHILIVGFGASVSGQIGDLVESMWKRSLNIKDSSGIIPGHGGILDRFDSLLFAAPFLFLYFKLFLS